MDASTAFIFSVCVGVVNVLDNILKPIVMGRGLNVPMPVVLIGTIGVPSPAGLTGVFLGPIVLVVIWDLLVALLDSDGRHL